ncbi:MAG TPA: exopolysaccharide biosynthesis polyprenyl glycosylphosphotransferase [Vicinamibacterales bacterium]|nr:exopolysaccharide biosynthesis polyprenyl glycosylphosphotransferase [Vicinamibacterales bacterium]
MARPFRPSGRSLLLAISDGVSATAAVTLAMWTWSLTAGLPFSWLFVRDHSLWFLAVPIWVMTLSPTRHASAALDLRETLDGLLNASGALLVAYLAAYFYAGADVLPRLMALYILWNAAWLTFGGRLLLLWTLTRDPFMRRMLVVGDGTEAAAALALAREPGLRDVQVLSPGQSAEGESLNVSESIQAMAVRLGATEVVVAVRGAVSDHTLDQLLKCREAGIEVVTLAAVYEQALQRVPVRHVGHDWLFTQLLSGAGSHEPSPVFKRAFDLVVAVALGVPGVLLGVVAAVAILLESGRPLFYSQVRQGRGGRLFRLTKFRTMKLDAEVDGPRWSPKDDPRITRVGRVLRKTHVDELPNLWAVLRGHLSMVGPRPERPEFIASLEREVPLYRARLIVTPGLTGWAQVNTEYGDSVEQAATKLEYDLYYVRHRSLWFDISILARTVSRMLGWKGR